MDTILLDPDSWDMVVDAAGNIAMATQPYSIAQDVASACRLFSGELWYDTAKGVPYFEQILGKNPPLSLIKAEIVKAALTVPNVVSAQCFISAFDGRSITGQVQVVDTFGTQTVVSI
ncbi:MAG: hypothetical protein B7X10_00575 [Burkholderiales bacterium 21-58-4]|nr:MAG: hypothetical protein B7X10_00575 [Burkholderiales bacterium 21-58-4]